MFEADLLCLPFVLDVDLICVPVVLRFKDFLALQTRCASFLIPVLQASLKVILQNQVWKCIDWSEFRFLQLNCSQTFSPAFVVFVHKKK